MRFSCLIGTWGFWDSPLIKHKLYCCVVLRLLLLLLLLHTYFFVAVVVVVVDDLTLSDSASVRSYKFCINILIKAVCACGSGGDGGDGRA
jgi:hypothetical protein